MEKSLRQSAVQIVDSSRGQAQTKVPIWVYEVNDNHIFPIKFEYKSRGYKGLRFSERKERIIYL